jgi:uncharacterized repeat protein (TIGR03803 family)
MLHGITTTQATDRASRIPFGEAPIAPGHPIGGAALALCLALAGTPCDAATMAPSSQANGLPGYAVVHSFAFRNGPEGHGPNAAMAVGQGAGDVLIGADFFGGRASPRCGCLLGGAIYSMTPDGVVTLLHAFSGVDGIGPNGQLVQGADGLWYGLTLGGGTFGHGTAYRTSRDGRRFEVLHSFGATAVEGSEPSPGPLARAADGSFYGSTSHGGRGGQGTVFHMTPDGVVTTLHDFMGSAADGSDPEDQPIAATDGAVYGTTTCGGLHEEGARCGGTLYRVTRSGSFTLLHRFSTKEGGDRPLSSPVQVGTSLFGSTSAGGIGDFGTLYRIGLDGTNFGKLHDFAGGLVASPPNFDGARPVGRLLAAGDGRLYGTTSNGGPNHQLYPAGDGTIFRIDASGTYALLGTLGADAADASHPLGALVQAPDGRVYGTTDGGGAEKSGTVFRFDLPAGGAASSFAGPAMVGAGDDPARTVPDTVEYSKVWSLVVADFDGDGHEDIFIAGHDQEDRIWYWSPTGYRPGPQTFPYRDRHGCAAADVDRDGRLDIFCEIGAEKGTGAADNELWHQQADGTFTSVPDFGAEDPYGRGRKPVFLDLNHDGWPDLYITNDSEPRGDRIDNFNRMFVNRGDGTFVEVATIATGSPTKPGLPGDQCVARGDVDGDGWDDLLVCNRTGPGRIFINDHANDFVDLPTPAVQSSWQDAVLTDMDGDGRDDLVLVTRDRVQIWLNSGTYPYFVTPTLDAKLPARGQSLTVGDFDGDTRKDLYVVLRGSCEAGAADAADVIFAQRTPGQWTMEPLQQPFGGCGYMAASIAGTQVLLANGTTKSPGPNYVLTFGPDSK